MAKENTKETTARFPLLSMRAYKRAQGRIVRQTTMISLITIALLVAWRAQATLSSVNITEIYVLFSKIEIPFETLIKTGVPLGSLILGLWFSFRIVHVPRFADFLIAVEAEMNKVSWPSQTELIKSSVVVIVVIFLLTGLLFGYDLLWRAVMEQLQIRRFY
jgi:preprotein translocase subunit SecE